MSSRHFGASPKKGRPLLRISATDSSRYGTDAITRSGLASMICSALADQESSTMMQPLSCTSGQTSTQYLVQATNRSSKPRSRSVTVTLGWSDTIRCGTSFSGIIELYKQNANGEIVSSRRFIVEGRGSPEVVIMEMRDFLKTIAPEPDVLQAIRAEAKKTKTSK